MDNFFRKNATSFSRVLQAPKIVTKTQRMFNGCLKEPYGKYFLFKLHIGERQFKNWNNLYQITQPTYYVNPKLS